MTSIVITNKQKILDQVEHGIELSAISKEMGITPSAICNQLASHEDYRQARVRGLETKLDNRERDLELATDQLEVSRGRELLKLAQWKLERLYSSVYGNQPKVAINITTKTTEVLDNAIVELVSSQLEDRDE